MTVPTGTPALRVAMVPLPSPRGNPFLHQMVERLEADGVRVVGASFAEAARADVLHLHWPDHFVSRSTTWLSLRGGARVLLMAALVRARRRAVVWTVHNLGPHERLHPGVERAFWPVFTRLVSGCIFLTAAGRTAAVRAFPRLARTASAVVPHGSYSGFYPPFDGTPEAARASVGLPSAARPLLFFGQVRRYKNVPGLLRAFADVSDPAARLVVAGSGPEPDLLAEVDRAAREDERVVVTGRVEDADVERIVAAAVGAVLPYHDVFNSGSLFLALSGHRPVLVPETEVFAEVRGQVGPQWVRFFEPPLTADDLEGFAAAAADLVASGARPDLRELDWERIGPRIVAFYASLQPGRPAG